MLCKVNLIYIILYKNFLWKWSLDFPCHEDFVNGSYRTFRKGHNLKVFITKNITCQWERLLPFGKWCQWNDLLLVVEEVKKTQII